MYMAYLLFSGRFWWLNNAELHEEQEKIGPGDDFSNLAIVESIKDKVLDLDGLSGRFDAADFAFVGSAESDESHHLSLVSTRQARGVF